MKKIPSYLLLLSPAVAYIVAVIIYPAVSMFVASFLNAGALGSQGKFVGLKNFYDLSVDPRFLNALGVSAVYTASGVGLCFTVGLFVALLLKEPLRGSTFVRSILMLPFVLVGVAVSYTFLSMFDPNTGVTAEVLRLVGIQFAGFSNTDWALVSVLIVTVWSLFPFSALVFLSGLNSIPAELYDAAKVDGATSWSRFRNITIPLLSNIALVNLIFLTIFVFNFFTPIFVITQGGPLFTTETTIIYMYLLAFDHFRTSYASGVAVVNFLIILSMVILYVRIIVKK